MLHTSKYIKPYSVQNIRRSILSASVDIYRDCTYEDFEYDSLDFFKRYLPPDLNIAKGECLYRLRGTSFYFSYWPEDGFKQWRFITYNYEGKISIDKPVSLDEIFEIIPEDLKQVIIWHFDILDC